MSVILGGYRHKFGWITTIKWHTNCLILIIKNNKLERGKKNMGKNKLPAVDFCKILDDFGEEAARDTLNDVNEGRISVETLEKYLYDDN